MPLMPDEVLKLFETGEQGECMPVVEIVPTRPLDQVKVGDEFSTAAHRFRVTDVGTRVIVAIAVTNGSEPIPEGHLHGPPFGVAEYAFDEYDQSSLLWHNLSGE